MTTHALSVAYDNDRRAKLYTNDGQEIRGVLAMRLDTRHGGVPTLTVTLAAHVYGIHFGPLPEDKFGILDVGLDFPVTRNDVEIALRGEVEKLRKEIRELNKQVAQIGNERDTARAAHADVKRFCDVLKGEVEALKASRLYFKDAYAKAMRLLIKYRDYGPHRSFDSTVNALLAKYGNDASK